ncbi:MAG TPA: hypothetical protein VGB75_17650 [Jatrophihabitans sp.]|jgi:hypothetical protein|uniref:hypothetical protein n=1 Tax=Jatrophihabitans sp. TaxID=1932789 RepID=UPI002F0211E4
MKVFRFPALLRSCGASSAKALRRRLSERVEASGWVDEETLSDPSQWQSVTILATPEAIAPQGRLPEPLAKLAGLIETRFAPAPGDRGTRLSARTRPGPKPDSTMWKGEDPHRQIRNALLHAKQLVEVGEVLAIEPQPAGKRRQPAAGLLVDLMTGDTDQEGVL